MRYFRVLPASLLAAGLATGITGQVAAQDRTTATYDDWTLQCDMQAGPPPQRVCEIMQIAQVQGHPFSRLAVEHPVQGQPVKLLAQLPINVSLRGDVRIQTGDADAGMTAPFDHCVPAGCFAIFDLKADSIKRFRSVTETGKLTFKNANGQDVAIPVSFKGFGAAFDALAKQ
jgi:invasion protein IalB